MVYFADCLLTPLVWTLTAATRAVPAPSYMKHPHLVPLDEELQRELDRLATETGRTRSDIALETSGGTPSSISAPWPLPRTPV